MSSALLCHLSAHLCSHTTVTTPQRLNRCILLHLPTSPAFLPMPRHPAKQSCVDLAAEGFFQGLLTGSGFGLFFALHQRRLSPEPNAPKQVLLHPPHPSFTPASLPLLTSPPVSSADRPRLRSVRSPVHRPAVRVPRLHVSDIAAAWRTRRRVECGGGRSVCRSGGESAHSTAASGGAERAGHGGSGQPHGPHRQCARAVLPHCLLPLLLTSESSATADVALPLCAYTRHFSVELTLGAVDRHHVGGLEREKMRRSMYAGRVYMSS